MIRKGIAAAVAAWASLAATGAYAAPQTDKPCFTQAEVQSIVTLMAPPAIRTAKTMCATTLGPGSYLGTHGDALAARFDAESAAALTVAMAAARKVPGMVQLNPETAKQMLAGLVGMGMTKITPETCRELDQGLQALDPLPAHNFSQLVAQIVRLKLLDKPNPDINICRLQS
jgi:hypothetical protein